jgi:hypothetical protein
MKRCAPSRSIAGAPCVKIRIALCLLPGQSTPQEIDIHVTDEMLPGRWMQRRAVYMDCDVFHWMEAGSIFTPKNQSGLVV